MIAILALIAVIGYHYGQTSQHDRVLDYDCVVYLPHSDYQQPEDFNNWLSSLPSFTNLEYAHGEWLADGKVVAYSDTEDAAITNGKCG
jgi:hypothetical protein